MSSTIQYIEDTWEKLLPDYPFEFFFIDERLNAMYQSERKMAESFNYFTLIAIFIACLGLFGLTSFIAEQKTREIGIRKVLGASVSKIIVMLSKEFIRWIILSAVIAFPVSWYAMDRWLQNFAYRTNLGFEVFTASIVIAFLIAQLTVSYHSIKAATADPVDSLKYE